MNKAVKRIINKDLKSIEHYKLNDQGIFIEFNEENMLEAHALIFGPKGSLYEGGYLFFNITFPKNYPFSPPDVSYVSRGRVRIHPNLYVKSHKSGFGKVCLSILGTWSGPAWTTVMDISTVLLSIQSILDKYPLLNEPGYNINDKSHYKIINDYNLVTFSESILSLIIRNYENTQEDFIIFKSYMNEYLKNNVKDIYNNIINHKCDKKLSIIHRLYNMNYRFDKDIIKTLYEEFCNKNKFDIT